jgi:SAM-dependent methyltransferase
MVHSRFERYYQVQSRSGEQIPTNGCWSAWTTNMIRQKMEESLKASYRHVAREYRASDEHHVGCAIYLAHCLQLNTITSSFKRLISVLDVGCGTGRYFHCLRNVKHLVGIDISPEMLAEAENPVRASEITAHKIELVCANANAAELPMGSFDLILSLGMFGHGCPVTEDLLRCFSKWLRRDGVLYFDAPDLDRLAWTIRWRRALKGVVYPLLPFRAQEHWDKQNNWISHFAYSEAELRALLDSSGFGTVQISSREQRFAEESRHKLECIASLAKAKQQTQASSRSVAK